MQKEATDVSIENVRIIIASCDHDPPTELVQTVLNCGIIRWHKFSGNNHIVSIFQLMALFIIYSRE